MDLINGVPRSGHDTVGGIVMLARAIDKMRAHIAGTLGEYVSHRGFSADAFELFGTDAETFEEIVRTHDTDEGVLASLMAIKHLTAEEIATFNLDMSTDPANNPQGRERLRARVAADHGDRLAVSCWFDLWDLDEGREVPIGGHRAAGHAQQ